MAVHHPAETTQNYSKEFFSSPIKTSAKTSEFIVEGFVITDLNIGTISQIIEIFFYFWDPLFAVLTDHRQLATKCRREEFTQVARTATTI